MKSKSLRTKEVLAALKRVLDSEVIRTAPFANYSEAISDAHELLARYSNDVESLNDACDGWKQLVESKLKELENKCDRLTKASARLAMFSNRLTAEWRHQRTIGKTVGDEEMEKLYDAQIQVEELTGRVSFTNEQPDPFTLKTAFLRVALWLESEIKDKDPATRLYYGKLLRERVEKEFK